MAERMIVMSFMAESRLDGVPTALARGRDPALRRPAARPERGGILQINRHACERIALAGGHRPLSARPSVGGRLRLRLPPHFLVPGSRSALAPRERNRRIPRQ